jgi:hypothetical protein
MYQHIIPYYTQHKLYYFRWRRYSSVGIPTRVRAGRFRARNAVGTRDFMSSERSRPALWSIQPRFECVYVFNTDDKAAETTR